MENKPLKHITDGTPPAWTVDWGYENKNKFKDFQNHLGQVTREWYCEKSWYAGFRNEEDAREFAAWYLKDQEHRIYPGSVKLHTKE